ncbi:DNA mismatch repair protein MutS [Cyanobacterium stanieri LEGE 03274]|uniref:DNA mismatch repair protein MutS n=1 Tax=Cyanobacterium stanieri LEGE 03274 TaxID=1828756 RepID=A0ABR9V2V9_9CHRO|nr:DNA mismatch repair protein MutS [Cyanobacterium stanieri]MBE9222243.1 DNA mismatch repair protein MutS [Cyanobacterium stanieri LEGE 03274]
MTEIVTTKATRNAPHEDYRLINIKDLTPMYHHYVEVKEQYPNCLLLYRVGDFFECFFQDAVTIAQELELVITSKDAGQNVGRIAMTGVPHHALDRYARQLVEKGYGVVICDQVEDASKATAEKRLVKRAITKLLTPGTVTDDEMLPSRQNNFLAAVVVAKEHWGLAYADISTGEFFTTQNKDLTSLATELLRLQPAEVLFPVNAPDINSLLRPGQKSEHLPEFLPDCFCYTLRSQKTFDINEAKPKLLLEFKLKSLEGVGCEHLPLAIRAAGGLLDYVQDTQKANQVPLQLIRTYSIADFLMLDATSRRNLEITSTVRDNTFHGSLLWALDKTCTAMGARALRRWLLQPLLKKSAIIARQDTIAELIDNLPLREEMRSLFKSIYDLERITGRVGAGTANPKELLNLGDSLLKLTYLAELAEEGKSPYFQALQNVPSELEELGKKVVDSLVESPPHHVKEGGIIRDGVNEQLDGMRRLIDGDKEWLANLEVTERERIGVNNLKVGYNKTFGYYISMPRSKAEFAPENYQRKQTLLNEERYITAELKEKENRILNAKDDLAKFEYQIFVDLRSTVAQKTDEIRKVARAIAAMDVLSGLAELSVYQDYNRPEITEDRTIKIKNGRHPVVEKILGFGMFVPNSTSLGAEKIPDLIVLTGPNASGKSCYLRQVGLIQLMTQIGSFIPAESAKISICDRIFTRVGAVDDIATGQSTFMVEMNETANILNHATDKSLVLLDEIGRGTATFDGLSIAWAVAEYLAIEIQSRTIFATHYHELNELASILENVANYQVTVKELENEIIFLHEVKPGGADKSYGIEAGRLAGLPKVVISRAKQVMTQIEKHSKIAMGLRKNIKKLTPSNQENREEIMTQLDIFE